MRITSIITNTRQLKINMINKNNITIPQRTVKNIVDKKTQIAKYRENNGDSCSEITLQQLETLNIPILNYYKADTNIYAGEYPFAEDEEIGFKKLSLLKEIGISYIIDLTEEGELIPYRQHIDSIEYLRFPIVDRGVPCSMNETKNICEIINRAIREGKFLYIHCWGGVGRTGTIVACWYVFHGYYLIFQIRFNSY